MIDVKRFSGVLNTDDKPENILGPQHINANNVRFYGGQNGLTAENIKGNYSIPNEDLPEGVNHCIGTFFDSLNQEIIWFNYNDAGNNGIYKIDLKTDTISTIFLCGTDSATDILNFNLDYPVHSINIVYRNQADGNLLYWTDSYNRPRYLNLSTVSALAPFTEDMLNAAKLPPLVPPTCVYGSDATVNYNNVRGRYFRFSYRWVYDSGEKSTFSPTSILDVPRIANPEGNEAPNVYNYISIANIYSGYTEDFKSIEIYGQEYNGATWGDFFLITELQRAVGLIPYTTSFKFYNDGIYTPITLEESDLRWDYIPDVANTQELLNGNTLIYGGLTEGYDNIKREDIDVQMTSTLVASPGSSTYEVWKWGQTERFGLVYFDKYGKTNGVVSYLSDATLDTTNFNVTNPEYPGEVFPTPIQIPRISASINHLPPDWAATYQWVRIDAAPEFFLQYVTNDYQDPGDGFLYFGIESLNVANSKDGLVPAFDFKAGDMVKVMGNYNSSFNVTAFTTQYTFQILDDVTRQMQAPNTITDGRFLKVRKPASVPAYTKNMLIEMYTPATVVTSENAIFYEWGQQYNIIEVGGIKYHAGQIQNQTASQPATFQWTNGYIYINSNTKFYTKIAAPNVFYGLADMMSRYYNVYQNSKANSNSRGWFINVNAKKEYLPVTVRWGGSYVQDTNVNNLNRFYPQDLDVIDRSRGDIRRFKSRDRILRVFQDRATGQYGVYARFIQNNSGQSELVTTNTIITTNNIQYYQGVYGLCGYSTNLVSTQNADYFADVVTGRCIRLAQNGLTDLGLSYKGQYYLSSLVTPYNKDVTRADGAKSKVMGFFDFFENQYHVVLEGSGGTTNLTFLAAANHFYFSGTPTPGEIISLTANAVDSGNVETFNYTVQIGDTLNTIVTNLAALVNASPYFVGTAGLNPPNPNPYVWVQIEKEGLLTTSLVITPAGTDSYNFSFNESRNAFCSFYDYHPEWATGANDLVYTWLDGVIYKHDNTTDYCNFYGDQYNASVEVVFNPNYHVKKSWNSVAEVASDVWSVPLLQTNTISYKNTFQQSYLKEGEFVKLEAMPSASIKRDINSSGGKANGDFLKGNYLIAKFQKESANNLITLSEVSVRLTDSPLNVK